MSAVLWIRLSLSSAASTFNPDFTEVSHPKYVKFKRLVEDVSGRAEEAVPQSESGTRLRYNCFPVRRFDVDALLTLMLEAGAQPCVFNQPF